MGGFYFLRFICPSLLAPHLYGLLDGECAVFYLSLRCSATLFYYRSSVPHSTAATNPCRQGVAKSFEQYSSWPKGRLHAKAKRVHHQQPSWFVGLLQWNPGKKKKKRLSHSNSCFFLTHSCFPLQVSSNLQPAARAIPEQVKQNALADIYNILLTCKGAIYQELGKHYNQGDGIYSELDAILSAGTIPSEQQ